LARAELLAARGTPDASAEAREALRIAEAERHLASAPALPSWPGGGEVSLVKALAVAPRTNSLPLGTVEPEAGGCLNRGGSDRENRPILAVAEHLEGSEGWERLRKK
jgi:hypothetical protein